MNALFFIAKNQVHYFDQQTDYEGILIHFNELFLVQNDNELDFLMKCSLFNNPYQQPSCCVGRGIEHILNEYSQQIKVELHRTEEFGREDLLRIYLKAFLIQVQRRKNEFGKVEGEAPFMVNEKRTRLIRFINLVAENYTKGLTVAEYAELMHLSTRTLPDLTHQLLNKTPSITIKNGLQNWYNAGKGRSLQRKLLQAVGKIRSRQQVARGRTQPCLPG